jgi:adenosine deaminase
MEKTPLVDLHRHLDGNVRLSTMIDIAKRKGLDLPAWDEEALRPHAQITKNVPDLLEFLKKFEIIQHVICDYQAVEQITLDNLEDAVKDGLDVVELRFSPFFMGMKYGLDTFKIVETICRTVNEQRNNFNCHVNLIVIMSRNLGMEKCQLELDAGLKFQKQGVIGIDLAGDEYNFPGELFVKQFQQAKAAGMRLTCHAGEAAGPESVRQAVEGLKAERIGHGVNAIKDKRVLDLLAEKGVTLEVCPTSNLQTNTVGSYAEHPMEKLHDAGVKVTLNTDDPGISNIDMKHELKIVQSELLLSNEKLGLILKNGWDAAFLTDSEREAILSK